MKLFALPFLSCRRSPRILFSSCFLFLSFFLLSFWQHVFFTYFPTFNFDQTWSQWPVCWPLLRHKQWWGQRSGWGHWGQKGHFHQKGIKFFKILSIDAWLMHMHKLDLLYKSYGPKNSSGVIWGHRGQKVIFTKKASSPSGLTPLNRRSLQTVQGLYCLVEFGQITLPLIENIKQW